MKKRGDKIVIKKRGLLCLKNKENLDLGHIILYEPYKNILTKFYELSINPQAIEFDPISRIFDGLESVSEEFKYYYEALLGVTSYYQHSQGGRGKYIEKRFSTLVETCSINIKISEFPLWLEHPTLHRKKGIFTLNGLTRTEKRAIRTIEWNYHGREDETTDVGNILRDKNTIVLVEIKNRVDSGGTAARREIWTKKFRTILDLLRNDSLFEKNGQRYSLADILINNGYEKIEIYIGILFNVDGTPATLEGDRERGFYSSNREGFRDLLDYARRNNLNVVNIDETNLTLSMSIGDLDITFGALYGDQIPMKLFRKNYSIADLLVLRYDDIWLSQLTSIWERTYLLEHGKNFTTIFKKILLRNREIRMLFNEFIESEGDAELLTSLVNLLLSKYSAEFPNDLCPPKRDREEYLADIIQFVGAVEA